MKTSVDASFDAIKQWMKKHKAARLVSNLANGATDAKLAAAEKALGFPIPADLRALWLVHDGQKREENGFVEWLDLLSTRRAVAERENVKPFLGFLREAPDTWPTAGVTQEEALSDRWIPIAARDSDSIVVSGESGRVFTCGKDSPPLRLLAASVSEWLARYAARVVADDFKVEEGFGDYYLEERDREKEAREAEEARRKAEKSEHYRKVTPLLTQLGTALGERNGEWCRDVFERLAKESPAQLGSAVDVLFGANLEPPLVATALQRVLRSVMLRPEQWMVVAKGGEKLNNNFIRDIAMQRARG